MKIDVGKGTEELRSEFVYNDGQWFTVDLLFNGTHG